MSNPFAREPDPHEITVTAEVVERRGDGAILRAIVEDGIAADGGEIEVRIAGSALNAYGIDECMAELEDVLNRTLRPAYRLDAALALGAEGPFSIVASAAPGGLQVLAPASGRLAA
jgi:hypothetical protein